MRARMIVVLLGIGLMLAMTTGIAGATTEVSGNQSGTWTLANSPYVVTGSVNVPAGQTLTIEPGVEVKFNDNQGIGVYGALNADGTSSQKITFTSNGDLSPDWWNSVYFNDGSSGVLDHCRILYAGYWEDAAVVVRGNASPTISNCEIAYVSGDGVRVYDNGAPSLINNTISHVEWPVRLHTWSAMPENIEGNTFESNSHYGIRHDAPTLPSGEKMTWKSFPDNLPYSVASVNVGTDATLTLSAGLIVKFDDNQGIGVYGALNAQGTTSEPIVFTAWTDDMGGDTNGDGDETAAEADWWNSVYFNDGSSGVLDHCRILYAGYWEDAAVVVRGNASPTISNCEIAYVIGDAVRVYDNGAPSLINNTISHVEWPVRLHTWSAMPENIEGNTFESNSHYGIRHDAPTLPSGEEMTWKSFPDNLPYSVASVNVGTDAALTLSAGLIVKFDDNQGIGVYGAINAQGTTSEPIVFTAWTDDMGGDTNGDGDETAAEADWWNSVYFNDGSSGVLDHCRILYTGYWEEAAVVIHGNASPTISNCEIAYVIGDAVRVYDNGAPSLINNTISHVEWPVRLHTWSAMPVNIEGNTFESNSHYGIRHDAPTLPSGEEMTWKAFPDNLPYSVASVNVGTDAALTLSAGLIVKFDDNQGIAVYGALNAQGATSEPIVFTAWTDDMGGDTNGDEDETAAEADWWNSVYFNDGSSGVLDHCRILYAGYWEEAAVVVRGNASPTISNCEIAYVIGDGVRVYNNAVPIISPNNILTDVSDYGVRNEGSATINARNNWWGDASGPYHETLNPDGAGVKVSDKVDFSPYLTAEPALWEEADTTPPVLTSGPSVSGITETSAVITWTTDETGSTIVEYGTTTAYGLSTTGSEGVTSHSVSLTGLSASTTYHYRVGSTDASENETWSEDATFTTQEEILLGPVTSNVQMTPSPTEGASEGTLTATVTASAPSSAKIVGPLFFERRSYTLEPSEKTASDVRGKIVAAQGIQAQFGNEHIKVEVNDNTGQFIITTADGRNLLYRSAYTSYTNVRIDGEVHRFGGGDGAMTTHPTQSGNSIYCVWEIGDLAITQRLTITRSSTTGNEDTFWIQIEIANNGAGSHEVGVFMEMDTMIGGNDSAPLSTSYGYSSAEREFTSTNMPTFWQAFEVGPTQGADKLVAQGTLIGGGAASPDRLVVGPYGSLASISWEYTAGGGEYGDSAVGIWWNPAAIASGGSRTVSTFYGLGQGSISEGVLSLNLSAPSSLSETDGELSPNPFEVNVLVSNTGGTVADGVEATITLPSGLSLASGESATKSVNPSSIASGQTGQVSWSVLASDGTEEGTVNYEVEVTSTTSGISSNSIGKSITIPATTSETLTVVAAEFFIGSDPGEGNGAVMAASDGGFDSPVEGVAATVDVSSLSAGSYTIGVRGRASDGAWGEASIVTLEVTTSEPSGIISDGDLLTYGVWRVHRDGDNLYFVGSDGSLAIKLWLPSNGWFNFMEDGVGYIVWSSGSSNEDDVEIPIDDILAATPTGDWPEEDGVLDHWACSFEEGRVVIRNDYDLGVDSYDGLTLQKDVLSATFQGRTTPLTIAEAPPSLAGDFNGDSCVNLSDFSLFAQNYGLSGGDIGFDSLYDLDKNGRIGLGDFSIFAQNYGRSLGAAKMVNLSTGRNTEASLSAGMSMETSSEGGRKVHLHVGIQGARDLAGYAFKVRYDPKQLVFLEADRNPENLPGNNRSRLPLLVASEPGQLLIADVAVGEETISGDGSLTDLIFSVEEGSNNLSFRIEMELLDAEEGVNALRSKEVNLLPEKFALHQNFPNPFNAETVIRYQLPETSMVRMTIYNLLGQEVRRLVEANVQAGIHWMVWDGRDNTGKLLSSGMYFCRLQVGDFVQTRSMVILK